MFGNAYDVIRYFHIDQAHQKLVTALSADDVALTHRSAQPVGNLFQKVITCGVAHGVIDVFEVIQVHKKQGQFGVLALRTAQGLLYEFVGQNAVGQVGERVVPG